MSEDLTREARRTLLNAYKTQQAGQHDLIRRITDAAWAAETDEERYRTLYAGMLNLGLSEERAASEAARTAGLYRSLSRLKANPTEIRKMAESMGALVALFRPMREVLP